MMGFIHVAVAVLCLLSVGQSAPVPSCENLIKPIEITGRDQLLGKWIHIAESVNMTGSVLLTKAFMESAWVKVTAANESDAINALQVAKMMGSCFRLTSKMTLANNTLSLVQPFTASEILLNTGCPDCLVFYSTYTMGRGTYGGLQLLSRRNRVTAAELEEFNKQVECLNLPPPAVLDPEKGVCPDESPSQQTETTDLTSVMNNMGSEIFSLVDSTLRSDDGVNKLLKMISDSVAGLKEN